MGRLKWTSSNEFDSRFGVKLESESDVKRHKIIMENKIMNVLKNNPRGTGKVKLAKEVGIDRKNLGSYMKKLIETKYVVRDKRFQGKFFVTNKIFKNPLLSGNLMAEMFASQVLGKENLILNDKLVNLNDVDYMSLLRYFQRDEFGLLRTIFEFVNKIGAYMTYVLIEAMNPENKYLQDSKYLEKDRIVQDWVSISINPIIRNLLSEFKESLRMELHSLVGDEKDPLGAFIEYGMRTPEFRLNKNVIEEILMAYSRLYPLMFRELENLRKNLPNQVQLYNDHREFLRMREKHQRSCKHNYATNVSRLIEYEGSKVWTKFDKSVVHCKRCHHTTYRKYIK